MKTQSFIKISTLFSAVFMTACSIPENGGSSNGTGNSGNKNKNSFEQAQMYYFYDEFVPEIGSFGIALSTTDSEGVFTELYLDFASDYFEDALRAVPANGTYTFSDSFDKHTFNNAYSTYIKKSPGGKITLGLLGGEFSLSRNGAIYTLHYNVKLGDGSFLTGVYEGKITGAYDSTISSDLSLDFNIMTGKGMEVARKDGNVWEVLLKGDSTGEVIDSGQVGVILMVHATEESSLLPEGKFGMAEGIKQNIKGTAEPASVLYNRMEGCYLSHTKGNMSWAEPGSGHVEITRQDNVYTISFSFKDANDHVVSGVYTGKIDVTWSTRATTRASVAPSPEAMRH